MIARGHRARCPARVAAPVSHRHLLVPVFAEWPATRLLNYRIRQRGFGRGEITEHLRNCLGQGLVGASCLSSLASSNEPSLFLDSVVIHADEPLELPALPRSAVAAAPYCATTAATAFRPPTTTPASRPASATAADATSSSCRSSAAHCVFCSSSRFDASIWRTVASFVVPHGSRAPTYRSHSLPRVRVGSGGRYARPRSTAHCETQRY